MLGKVLLDVDQKEYADQSNGTDPDEVSFLLERDFDGFFPHLLSARFIADEALCTQVQLLKSNGI